MAETDSHQSGYVRLADVVRNDFVEGAHFGRVAAIAPDGAIAFALGDIDQPIHPRSTNKLLQAAAMVSLSLDLAGHELALAAASHWGQPKHVDAVRHVLQEGGLDEHSLQCTPALPGDEDAKRAVLMAGGTPSPIYHGCSGKHAAMLRTCILNGWGTGDYLDMNHPMQVSLRGFVEVTIGESTTHAAVDGCGAPAWAMPLTALARAYLLAVSQADRNTPLSQVADAMRVHPDFVCGDASEVTGLMRAVPGLLVKDGAEAVYVAAHAERGAVAVKIADGGFRAGQVVLVAALQQLGVAELPGVDANALARWGQVPVLGHGEPVGRIRPMLGPFAEA